MTRLTSAQLIWKGYLLVNIPVMIIILSVFFILRLYLHLGVAPSILFGSAIGWIYWEYAVLFWIRWALKNNVEKERLHTLGVNSLLLWKKDIKKIEKILKQLNMNK